MLHDREVRLEDERAGQQDEFVRGVTRAMAEGSERAFGLFHERYVDRIYRHLLVRARGEELLARELMQAVYLRLVRHGREFEGEGKLWAWVKQVARSCHVD